MKKPVFHHIALLGLGLIGSSLARAIKHYGLAGHVSGWSRRAATRTQAKELGLCDSLHASAAQAVKGADCVMFCVPLSAYESLAQQIAPALAQGAVVSDVGSVKSPVAKSLSCLPNHIHLIPGHPVAGTEESGPQAGFADLFIGRQVILTPLPGTSRTALATLKNLWQGSGARVRILSAKDHDRILALTSHAPHMAAYALVHGAMHSHYATSRQLIDFSAGGFRDFTRVAASHPLMWRDIFLANAKPVAGVIAEMEAKLAKLRRAMLAGDGDYLVKTFTQTRKVRQAVVKAGQDDAQPDFGRTHAPAKIQTKGRRAASLSMRSASRAKKSRDASPGGIKSKKRKQIAPL